MIRLALILALAAVLLNSGLAVAQVTCQASEPWPGSQEPAGVDVLTPTFGAIALAALGIDSPEELAAVVVVRGATNVVIFVMKPGFACRGRPCRSSGMSGRGGWPAGWTDRGSSARTGGPLSF